MPGSLFDDAAERVLGLRRRHGDHLRRLVGRAVVDDDDLVREFVFGRQVVQAGRAPRGNSCARLRVQTTMEMSGLVTVHLGETRHLGNLALRGIRSTNCET